MMLEIKYFVMLFISRFILVREIGAIIIYLLLRLSRYAVKTKKERAMSVQLASNLFIWFISVFDAKSFKFIQINENNTHEKMPSTVSYRPVITCTLSCSLQITAFIRIEYLFLISTIVRE